MDTRIDSKPCCDACEMYKYHVYDPLHLVVSQNQVSLSLIEYGL